MSERKSWDIAPKPRKSAPPAPAPEPVRAAPRAPQQQRSVRAAEPVRTRPTPRPQAPQAPQGRPSPRRAPLPAGTLRERRKRRRRVIRSIFLTILLLLIVGFFYLVWRPSFRISAVNASGPGADAAKQIVLSHIAGSYAHIIPRNSIFFYPSGSIRAAILDAIPDASAVSLKRNTFSSLNVLTLPREESFIWCGTSIDTPDPNGCYEADVEGYVFRAADGNVASSTLASSTAPTATTTASTHAVAVKVAHEQVRVFAPLTKDLADGQSPIRSHVSEANYLTNALKFVDAVRTLGAPVSSLALRGDEADLWLNGPTRITYVLGQEQQAAEVAASALPTLNLTDGSIQYIDLRFPGKAYVKRYGQ